MARVFRTNIDLGQREIFGLRLQILASDPGSPVSGQIWYRSDTNRVMYFDGTVARDVTDALTLGGQNSAFHLSRTNHTGSQLASTISDFDTQVRTSRLDQMANPAASVSMNTQKIINLLDPTSAQDAASKAYVDSQTAGARDPKDDARVGTNAALPANTRTGNVLTASANGALNDIGIDGVTDLALNDRVLVKDEATGANRGLFYVSDLGSAGTPWTLTRTTDADASNEVTAGLYVWVSEGTANSDTGWLLTTNNPITLNTTSLTFSQISALGQITAGAGLTKTGSTLDVIGTTDRILVNADSVDISPNYVGQASITTLGTITTGTWNGTDIAVADGGTGASTAAGARTNLGFMVGFAASIGDGVALAYVVNHALNSNDVLVQVSRVGSPKDVIEVDIERTDANNVTIRFTGTAPTTNEFRCVVAALPA